jgi:hypothetical protein
MLLSGTDVYLRPILQVTRGDLVFVLFLEQPLQCKDEDPNGNTNLGCQRCYWYKRLATKFHPVPPELLTSLP